MSTLQHHFCYKYYNSVSISIIFLILLLHIAIIKDTWSLASGHCYEIKAINIMFHWMKLIQLILILKKLFQASLVMGGMANLIGTFWIGGSSPGILLGTFFKLSLKHKVFAKRMEMGELLFLSAFKIWE